MRMRQAGRPALGRSCPTTVLLPWLLVLILLGREIVSNSGRLWLSLTESNGVEKVSVEEANCNAILDRLDATFNQRRLSRQQVQETSNAMLYWFDHYEPEANCLTEERFGSGSPRRYEAFGDGPKFICGVDMIASKDCLVYSGKHGCVL